MTQPVIDLVYRLLVPTGASRWSKAKPNSSQQAREREIVAAHSKKHDNRSNNTLKRSIVTTTSNNDNKNKNKPVTMAEEARGICVRDVTAPAFIKAYAEHLKNSDKFELPVWADTVKTATFKELAPYGDDWYYIRAASIARKVYLHPGIGVGQLQKWYGGNNRRGARTEHFRKAASGIIRSVLLQLEEMKVTEKLSGGGRRVTRVGQQDLDRIAGSVFRDGEEDEDDDDDDDDEEEDEF